MTLLAVHMYWNDLLATQSFGNNIFFHIWVILTPASSHSFIFWQQSLEGNKQIMAGENCRMEKNSENDKWLIKGETGNRTYDMFWHKCHHLWKSFLLKLQNTRQHHFAKSYLCSRHWSFFSSLWKVTSHLATVLSLVFVSDRQSYGKNLNLIYSVACFHSRFSLVFSYHSCHFTGSLILIQVLMISFKSELDDKQTVQGKRQMKGVTSWSFCWQNMVTCLVIALSQLQLQVVAMNACFVDVCINLLKTCIPQEFKRVKLTWKSTYLEITIE